MATMIVCDECDFEMELSASLLVDEAEAAVEAKAAGWAANADEDKDLCEQCFENQRDE